MAEVTVSFPRAKTHSEEEAGDVLKAGACPGAASGDAGSSTASTALARRWPHVGARSPQRPGSGSRPPFLSACQPACPACFLPLSFCLFFLFFGLFCIFFFLPCSRSAGRERGCRQRRGWEEGWGLRSSVCKAMGAHPSATAASREVTSFPPSALCSSPQRQRGWTGLSQQLLCLGPPLGPAAGVLLSAKPPPPPLPCVTSGAWPCCPRLWGRW